MEMAHAADREQLDQAADLLMTSLRKSRDLNIEIRHAFLLREKADRSCHSEGGDESGAAVFGLLRDIINDVSRP